ncbi:TPA: AAA family ATPase [Vibrio vulnificus]
MKICYTPKQNWRSPAPSLPNESSYISLSGNNWDDYGIKTTLNVTVVFDNVPYPTDFCIQLLIENCGYTSQMLDELCANGWDGNFPIPDLNYVSLATDIDFYRGIQTKLDGEQAKRVLLALRDAGYLVNVMNDKNAKALTETDRFSSSLLRGSGNNKVYQDAWRLFVGEESQIRDFTLSILTYDWQTRAVPFRFESSLLPYDINVLIGPNGIGKSFCLRSLVEYWLQIGMGDKRTLDSFGHAPFDNRPNLNRLVLVSYSPFEEFSLGLDDEDKILDKSAYRYFGFRQKRIDGSIGISRNLPKLDASNSLIDAIYEDAKYQRESWWVNKLATVEDALKKAFYFEYLAIKVDMEQATSRLKSFPTIVGNENYFRLNSSVPTHYDCDTFKTLCQLSDGIQFVADGKIKQLSSGQRLFMYIVINVVGSIREHSLIVIDEPELFLHPTLEIDFVSLLKSVLKSFKSKAVLATHSLSVVREVPSKCVHIFRDEGNGLEIVPPPFETFGGSFQKISSYVFGDKSISKPFDDWLKLLIEEEPNAEKLIESLGEEVNEQLIMKILRLGRQANGI